MPITPSGPTRPRRIARGACLTCLAWLGAVMAAPSGVAQPARAEEHFAGLGPVRPEPQLSLRTGREDWYKDAVVYHLWVSAFRDSDASGFGDLDGIIQGLDTLKDLGVNTLWLSPFFTSSSSPRNLHGYDVVDHYTVDPRLGTNDDARRLVREAHARGIRLIFDFVPNHLSSRHPWFLESKDPASPKRDWFVWRSTPPEKGWTGFDGRSDWHRSQDGYYYGIFSPGMPDVNHRNAEVRLELAKAARHWLDLGFDGLRVDAIRYLYENLEGSGVRSDQEDRPESVAWFESFRRDVIDPYARSGYAKFMVAENWTNDRKSLLAFLSRGEAPVFHMTLNFPMLPAFTKLDAAAARKQWEWDAQLPPSAWLGYFTSNHDLAADRPGTLFAADPRKARAQAAWLLLGPGTPFIYFGNEIAQPQGPERGDTKHRKALDWAEVERQKQDPGSSWRWHQALIRLRDAHASIRRGKARLLDTPGEGNVLALWRVHGDERTLTLFSATDGAIDDVRVVLPQDIAGKGAWVLGEGPAVDGKAGEVRLGRLGAYEAKVVLFRE